MFSKTYHINSDNYISKIDGLDLDDTKKTALSESINHLNNPERIEQAK